MFIALSLNVSLFTSVFSVGFVCLTKNLAEISPVVVTFDQSIFPLVSFGKLFKDFFISFNEYLYSLAHLIVNEFPPFRVIDNFVPWVVGLYANHPSEPFNFTASMLILTFLFESTYIFTIALTIVQLYLLSGVSVILYK